MVIVALGWLPDTWVSQVFLQNLNTRQTRLLSDKTEPSSAPSVHHPCAPCNNPRPAGPSPLPGPDRAPTAAKQSSEVSAPLDVHKDYDLRLRAAYCQHPPRPPHFSHTPELFGKCHGVPGEINFDWHAAPTTYMKQYELRGSSVVLQPKPLRASRVRKQCIPSSLEYELDTSDPYHWCWRGIPGTEAGSFKVVEGASHGVAARRLPLPPSDPTIEQCKPSDSPRVFLTYDEEIPDETRSATDGSPSDESSRSGTEAICAKHDTALES